MRGRPSNLASGILFATQLKTVLSSKAIMCFHLKNGLLNSAVSFCVYSFACLDALGILDARPGVCPIAFMYVARLGWAHGQLRQLQARCIHNLSSQIIQSTWKVLFAPPIGLEAESQELSSAACWTRTKPYRSVFITLSVRSRAICPDSQSSLDHSSLSNKWFKTSSRDKFINYVNIQS